jgi:hypothetical protein
VKNKIVTLAVDDSPHDRQDLDHYRPNSNLKSRKSVPLIGVINKGLQLLEVNWVPVEVDGIDGTQKVLKLYQQSSFQQEIRLILINATTVAGFNIIDPFELFNQTQIPVLLVSDNKPRSSIVEIYSKIFPQRTEQIEILKRLPQIEELKVPIRVDPHNFGTIYFHNIGCVLEEVIPLLHYLSYYSALPEPLRLAHTIAAGYSTTK